MVTIGFTLYFMFAGYSDIAIGFARMLGFRIMENFNWPYLKKNISEFWNAWHISLTSWSREYIFTSVIATTRSPALASVASLVSIGLWHEVSVRYLLWGIYHGLAVAIWQRFQTVRKHSPVTVTSRPARLGLDILSTVLTVHFVWLGFLLVRQTSVADMGNVLYQLFYAGW